MTTPLPAAGLFAVHPVAPQGSHLAVVRRDRADVFETLCSRSGEGLVDVIWDRRFWNRRAGVSRIRERLDRRRADRRGPVSAWWEAHGYVLVPLREGPRILS